MPQVAHEGIGVDASAGYRIDRNEALSLGGEYQELNAQISRAARGGTATVAAQYHIAISSPRVSTFVFAGVQGRLDVGGNKVGTATLTSASPSARTCGASPSASLTRTRPACSSSSRRHASARSS